MVNDRVFVLKIFQLKTDVKRELRLETEWKVKRKKSKEKLILVEHFCETLGVFYFNSSSCIYPLAFSFGLQVCFEYICCNHWQNSIKKA